MSTKNHTYAEKIMDNDFDGKASKAKFDVATMITDKFIAALEAGTVPWRNPVTCKPAQNLVSRRQYSGINTLILWIETRVKGYTSPYWATYKQIEAAGGHVRKGQKATAIVYYRQLRVKDANATPERVAAGKDERSIPLLRYYNVFNLDQTEGLTVAVAATDTRGDTADFAVDANGTLDDGRSELSPQTVIDTYVEHGGPKIVTAYTDSACYIPSTDTVEIPTLAQYVEVAGDAVAGEHRRYHSLYHELIHSTGHGTRLDRESIGHDNARFGTEPYAKEELIAEIGAAMLASQTGIDSSAGFEQSAAYVARWLKALKDDRKLVLQAASAAQKGANLILNGHKADTEEETEGA